MSLAESIRCADQDILNLVACRSFLTHMNAMSNQHLVRTFDCRILLRVFLEILGMAGS